jgi:hypothetical protein
MFRQCRMSRPPRWALLRICLTNTTGQRYSLGWLKSKKEGPFFVVVRISAWDTRKVLDRFPLTEDGWAGAWAALEKVDATEAQAVAGALRARLAEQAERERRSQVYELFAQAGRTAVFQALGVQVIRGGDTVYDIGYCNAALKTNFSRPLGPLAGAEAIVTDGAQAWSPGRAMFMPVGLVGLASKTKADAAVVFSDGTVHTVALDGNNAVREAQKEVVQFNALAGTATPQAENTGIDSDPAARLRKLQELRDANLLTQEEYETKRTEIINSL